ncbi:MAG: LptF/LptG family permease [Thermus sp.]|uniref:LptF/LptG family permease n=1 Tax=unclassified Thermus TaxID=2619321 RepID=UPI0002389D8A|nr:MULTISPECIES: LptF/LptG family permease [unclassified Thermus]AEV15474.1 Permease YjgP/YjgQ [Thermus sp. CCB_US3_UF1]MCS7218670.1 LptF/LptG family permease [Thermus sp.]MCX7848584.1 LptF/LptG family permease [Thermus sp.]MDW8017903.1 LptF/LptG family permease [Thermus sp.]
MLGRYALKEVLVPYLVGVFLFVALLTFDLLSSLSGVLLSRGVGVEAIGRLILLRLPWTLSLALPLGLVFAILVGLARLIRHSELKAAYAAGVPPWALLKPLGLLALGVSLLNLANLAELRPRALEAYDAHLARLLYGEGGLSGVLRQQLYAPPGLGVYYAEEVRPEVGQNRLFGVRVVDPQGRVYSGAEGVWDAEGWHFRGYVLEGGRLKPFQGTLPFPAQFRPKESLGSRDPYDTSTLGELWERGKVESGARFALARRLADALGGFFLAWVAAALGLSFREAAWAFLSIVLLIFGYYVLWTFSAQLARYDVNPLWAFLPNGAFAALALGLTWRLR